MNGGEARTVRTPLLIRHSTAVVVRLGERHVLGVVVDNQIAGVVCQVAEPGRVAVRWRRNGVCIYRRCLEAKRSLLRTFDWAQLRVHFEHLGRVDHLLDAINYAHIGGRVVRGAQHHWASECASDL